MTSNSQKDSLRLAALQFRGSGDVEGNAESVLRGMDEATRQGAQLLVTQECALTGYAEVDIASPDEIDRDEAAKQYEQVARAAKAHNLYVALGTTDFDGDDAYNALHLIAPDSSTVCSYRKRAMYGADAEHYCPGDGGGVCAINDMRVGLRICYEFRFPEYFRELLLADVQLAVTAFSMVGADDAKFETARAHLMSRAAENGLWIAAANNVNGVQNCPTCIVNPDGKVVAEAPRDREALIVGEIEWEEPSDLRADIMQRGKQLSQGDS